MNADDKLPFAVYADGAIKLRDARGRCYTWLQNDEALELLRDLSAAIHEKHKTENP